MEKYNLSIKTDLNKFVKQYWDEGMSEPTNYQLALVEAMNSKKVMRLQRQYPKRQYLVAIDPASKEGDKGCTIIGYRENGLKGDSIIIDKVSYDKL